MRYASIDPGIRIDVSLDTVRRRTLGEDAESERASGAHWVSGVITYPPLDGEGEPETGYLLYLKSSFTGDESEVVREYRHRNPSFPHQSTSDQAFDENQSEAYRALGEHIAEDALAVTASAAPVRAMPFAGPSHDRPGQDNAAPRSEIVSRRLRERMPALINDIRMPTGAGSSIVMAKR